MKKVILPAAILIAGVGAAFATKANQNALVNEQGAYFNNATETCIKTDVQCQPNPTTACTYFDGTTTQSLKRFVNNTECGIQLYMP
ncbi:DUF6520 family protein [Elizabethkingia anophelis]|uniref:DUF6520 family protein n=1 Tax=Elizabethkingia anophelis TaxID=1117645 RepID=UPI00136AF6B7|nr:DUF6520 family protein [Elizabethkingia anophelis]MYY43978.1 hypothetical protein [Elizabethkingia anophelis]